jgi:hypothetical protein
MECINDFVNRQTRANRSLGALFNAEAFFVTAKPFSGTPENMLALTGRTDKTTALQAALFAGMNSPCGRVCAFGRFLHRDLQLLS